MLRLAIVSLTILMAGQSALAWDFQSGCKRAKALSEKSKAYLAADDYVQLNEIYKDYLQTLEKKVERFCMTVNHNRVGRFNDQNILIKGIARFKGMGPGDRIQQSYSEEICDSDKELAGRVASLTKYKEEAIRPLALRVRGEMEALKPKLAEYAKQYKFQSKSSWYQFADSYLEFGNWVLAQENPLQLTRDDFDWTEINGERCESQRAWAAMNRGRRVVIP